MASKKREGKRPETNRATSATYRQRRIERGLCTSCGNEPARQGRLLGEICTKKRSEEGRRRRGTLGKVRKAQKAQKDQAA